MIDGKINKKGGSTKTVIEIIRKDPHNAWKNIMNNKSVSHLLLWRYETIRKNIEQQISICDQQINFDTDKKFKLQKKTLNKLKKNNTIEYWEKYLTQEYCYPMEMDEVDFDELPHIYLFSFH